MAPVDAGQLIVKPVSLIALVDTDGGASGIVKTFSVEALIEVPDAFIALTTAVFKVPATIPVTTAVFVVTVDVKVPTITKYDDAPVDAVHVKVNPVCVIVLVARAAGAADSVNTVVVAASVLTPVAFVAVIEILLTVPDVKPVFIYNVLPDTITGAAAPTVTLYDIALNDCDQTKMKPDSVIELAVTVAGADGSVRKVTVASVTDVLFDAIALKLGVVFKSICYNLICYNN